MHTGQHYDHGMSDVFFQELEIPAPDYHLGIGSGPHGAQTGAMLAAIETVLEKERPDTVIVYGDTNSTLAGALAAVKLHIPVAHVEAGLRSFNRAMPEEINRVVTDHISRWLFTPSESSAELLNKEGIVTGTHVVGDIMADTVQLHRGVAERRSTILHRLGVREGQYYLATVHRPENTDHSENLMGIFAALDRLNKRVVLPLHPRTRKWMDHWGIRAGSNILITEPLGYLDMLRLQSSAACILTDSGGIQKEAYYLKVPCVTMRGETEWIETLATGWNQLCGANTERILAAVGSGASPDLPHPNLYGDGETSRRIVDILSSDRL